MMSEKASTSDKVPKIAIDTFHPTIDEHPDSDGPLPSPRPIPSKGKGRGKTTKVATVMAPDQEIDLNILLKFIKPFDGSREKINSFIINCNNAIDLASAQQEPILFKYVLSQLQGKAEIACSIKEFSNWEQLKDFLKTQFSERKHYTHLLMELQEAKQGASENVSQFALRVETCLSQLLTEISITNTKVKELSGRTAAMEDLALHHFIMGLHPRISNIIRCNKPQSLNEAVNLAVSEERIQLTLYKKPISEPPRRPNNPNPNQGRQSFNRPLMNNSTEPLCRYCKSVGHTIDNCKRREFNNSRYQNKFQPSANTSNNFNPSRRFQMPQPSSSGMVQRNQNFDKRVFSLDEQTDGSPQYNEDSCVPSNEDSCLNE